MFYQSSIYLLFIHLCKRSVLFAFSYQTGQIWGNLISYFVLQPKDSTSGNGTTNITTTKYDKCGADFSQNEYTTAEATNEIDRKTV